MNLPDDGYTDKFFIAASPGIHKALRGTYRRMRRLANTQLRSKLRNLSEEQADAQVAKAVAERITTWDLKDRKGETKAVSSDELLNMEDSLFFRLVAIVRGIDSSDVDPEWTAEEVAAFNGETSEEQDRGN